MERHEKRKQAYKSNLSRKIYRGNPCVAALIQQHRGSLYLLPGIGHVPSIEEHGTARQANMSMVRIDQEQI